MSERLGNVYDGVISGVTEWGLYVEINENKCEGMLPIRDLDDDYYEFDEKNYCLAGRRNHKSYRLGDAIKIQVVRANLERKQLDFALATEEGAVGGGKPRVSENADYKRKSVKGYPKSKDFYSKKRK